MRTLHSYFYSYLCNSLAGCLLWLACLSAIANSQERLFSGPQVGEDIADFVVRGVFDDQAGKERHVIKDANGKAHLVIFVHDVNRQSISFIRILGQYAHKRRSDNLVTDIVWLKDDLTAAEAQLKQIRHALPVDVPIGVSVDGREGSGSLGLNHKVTLTILLAKDEKVVANFALVQPSLQVDLPKVLQKIVDLIGGKVPEINSLEGMPKRETETSSEQAPHLRAILTPLIARDASDEQVDEAAKTIQRAAKDDRAVRKELARIANTIVRSGKLENYGTPRAQAYLAEWAKSFSEPADSESKDDKTDKTTSNATQDPKRKSDPSENQP